MKFPETGYIVDEEGNRIPVTKTDEIRIEYGKVVVYSEARDPEPDQDLGVSDWAMLGILALAAAVAFLGVGAIFGWFP